MGAQCTPKNTTGDLDIYGRQFRAISAISANRSGLSTILGCDQRLGNGPAPFVGPLKASAAALAKSHPAAPLPFEDGHQRWTVSAEEAAKVHSGTIA
jgi:hypothetical protein